MNYLEKKVNKIRYGDLKTRKRWFLIAVIFLFSTFFAVWLIFLRESFKTGDNFNRTNVEASSFKDFLFFLKTGFLVLKEKIYSFVSNLSILFN